jgi:hypothetical protein
LSLSVGLRVRAFGLIILDSYSIALKGEEGEIEEHPSTIGLT